MPRAIENGKSPIPVCNAIAVVSTRVASRDIATDHHGNPDFRDRTTKAKHYRAEDCQTCFPDNLDDGLESGCSQRDERIADIPVDSPEGGDDQSRS